ncbi:MAG TPA: RidA family protein [Bacillota bacterium]
MSFERRLAELGINLPPAPKPVAAYVPAVRSGSLLFVSGQVPLVGGQIAYRGKVGKDLSTEEGQQAARTCALNALAVVRAAAGSLDQVRRIVRLGVFVQCSDDFKEQPLVANGASQLLVDIFGEAGRHARTAVGCNALPLDSAVEVELVVELGA